MASSIAAAAVRCCPAKIAPQSSLLRTSCDSASLGSKQSLIFLGQLHPENVFAAQNHGHANARLLHVVDCQQRQEKPGLVGPQSKSGILQSVNKKSGDGIKLLAVTEGVCLAVAGASYTASVLQKNQQSASVASSSANQLFAKFGGFSTWQIPALWAALVINALVRSIQWQSSSNNTIKKWEEKSITDFTVDQRVGKLEDEVQSVAAIARTLSRHLEKLGVRFRVTRRTLRDPIQETAVLAQKTSEVVSALATREDMLEAELRETQREFREVQQILVSMQGSQEKQLELLLTAMTKTLKSQKALEERLSKRLAGITNKLPSTGVDAVKARKESVGSTGGVKSIFVDKLGVLKKSFMEKMEPPTKMRISGAQAVEAEKAQLKEELIGDGQKGRLGVPPSTKKSEVKKSIYKPDTSFTKEDFWSNTPTTSAAELSVEHEVVDYLTSPNRTTEASPKYSDNPQGNGRLDSFFSGRKNINSYQAPINLSSEDYHNPGFSSTHSQSGDYSGGSGRHREYTMGFGFNSDNYGQGNDKAASSEVAPEIGFGSFHIDHNNWSNLGAGDFSSGSGSGSGSNSPRHSVWSGTNGWDFTSGAGSPRQSSWYATDCSSGSGSPRIGEGIINFVQAGFVDTDILREFKDGYASS